VRVGYLINQYPKISHTFIRREIQALEQMGTEVVRFAIRPVSEPLTDPADREEEAKTHVLLKEPPSRFLSAALRSLVSPQQLADATVLATECAQRAERKAVHAAYLAEALRLRDACREHGVEHIHAHFGTNPATVAMLCRAAGGPPYSFTVHGPEEFDRPFELHLSEKIHRSKFVAGISSFGRSQLLRRTPFSEWDKVHIVRCGVDAQFLAGDASPVPDNRDLINVGRLSEQKGQMIAVEALAKVQTPGVRLRFIGDGELRPALEDRVRELGLEDQVAFTGWASGEEVRQALMSSRGMVLPSFAEGLPVVLMEALALARPVVTTYIAGIPELVRPGENGWLVPAGDVSSLAEAIDALLTTPTDDLGRMGQDGRRRVLDQHDVAKNAAELDGLFRS
jgi:glycosyltransferase involved in cell wall biosynthesis